MEAKAKIETLDDIKRLISYTRDWIIDIEGYLNDMENKIEELKNNTK